MSYAGRHNLQNIITSYRKNIHRVFESPTKSGGFGASCEREASQTLAGDIQSKILEKFQDITVLEMRKKLCAV
ncbi:unnamed protein product [Bathycoccus prasinos]